MTPQALDEFATKVGKNILLVFSSPSNPTGKTYSSGELKKLANVMRKHDMLVVSDEIYSLTNFYSECPSLYSYYPEG
jgi:aspartate/methionine/tyrosine aminotransferase